MNTQDQDRTDENSLEVSYVTTTSHALLLHPARLERTIYSSEVRRVTNYARGAINTILIFK